MNEQGQGFCSVQFGHGLLLGVTYPQLWQLTIIPPSPIAFRNAEEVSCVLTGGHMLTVVLSDFFADSNGLIGRPICLYRWARQAVPEALRL